MNQHQPPLLSSERIKFLKKIESKKCAFDTLTDLLAKGQSEVTKKEVFDALTAREKLGNTTIGNGIAIPRAHLDITYPRAAVLILKKGINLNAADKIEVRLFLAILIPNKEKEMYEQFIRKVYEILTTDKKYNYKIFNKELKTNNPELILNLFESLFKKAFATISEI